MRVIRSWSHSQSDGPAPVRKAYDPKVRKVSQVVRVEARWNRYRFIDPIVVIEDRVDSQEAPLSHILGLRDHDKVHGRHGVRDKCVS